ncbi:MAG: helix-turn-helix domain-containing protein [Chloroflexi bacterium]|nr:helix-turn-helix domain-containing protein [Chloroflexota bacterium]
MNDGDDGDTVALTGGARAGACLSDQAALQLSGDLGLLGHPVRLQILAMLAQHGGAICVCDLEAALPVKQPTVSHHLRLLREAGLIASERRGLWAYYAVRHDVLTAMRARVLAGFDALTRVAREPS